MPRPVTESVGWSGTPCAVWAHATIRRGRGELRRGEAVAGVPFVLDRQPRPVACGLRPRPVGGVDPLADPPVPPNAEVRTGLRRRVAEPGVGPVEGALHDVQHHPVHGLLAAGGAVRYGPPGGARHTGHALLLSSCGRSGQWRQCSHHRHTGRRSWHPRCGGCGSLRARWWSARYGERSITTSELTIVKVAGTVPAAAVTPLTRTSHVPPVFTALTWSPNTDSPITKLRRGG
jgi:hypothetical protein